MKKTNNTDLLYKAQKAMLTGKGKVVKKQEFQDVSFLWQETSHFKKAHVYGQTSIVEHLEKNIFWIVRRRVFPF